MSVDLMTLFEGIAALPHAAVQVADLTLDSREVRSGSLFVALAGTRSHGLEYAAEAAARGASAVLWEPDPHIDELPAAAAALAGSLYVAPVPGLRQILGRVADRFFGSPSAHLRVVGFTGTNGKTTCAYLLAQGLEFLQRDAAYIGTLGWGRLGALQTPTHTTPDVISVHRMLAGLLESGVRDVAMEVSSHALDQGRVDGVRFHTAAFTNLSRDHLDYHVSMDAYGAAKARLFAFCGLHGMVINVGDAFGREIAANLQRRAPLTAVSVGRRESPRPADRTLYVDEVALDLHGLSMRVHGDFADHLLKSRLMGRFNAENMVLVLGCLLALDATIEDAAQALSVCHAPPGRMEVIEAAGGGKPLAVIDYAHTPDALAKALSALRAHCRGRLWCVFGCGGDRDPGKRRLMGAVADELADAIIVTDDNPRSEDPTGITHGILEGIKAHRARVIHDRGEAIGAALGEAGVDDMVLIAGKGHEDYQIYGATRRRFSDRQQALRCLGEAA